MNKNYILMTLACIFWGASFVFIKIVFKYIGPITMIFTRLVIASILLLIIYRVRKSRDVIERKDFLLFFFMGFTEPFLYFIGEGFGMQYVSSTHASVIVATIPLFSMIGSVILYKEKIRVLNIVGVLISFTGIIVMIGFSDLLNPGSLKGIALMFLAVLSAVVNSLILFKLGSSYSTLTIITVQNIVGGLLFLPLFIGLESSSLTTELLNSELILSLLFLAIFPSVLSFMFYISTLRAIGITKTTAITNLIPVITAIIAFFMLGSRFQIRELLGIALVIGGLFISQRKVAATEIPYEG